MRKDVKSNQDGEGRAAEALAASVRVRTLIMVMRREGAREQVRDMTEVRLARESDIPALCDLYCDFHEFHAERIPGRLLSLRSTWDEETAELAERLREVVGDGDSEVLVAVSHGEISGFSEVYLRVDEETRARPASRYCHVQSMFVVPLRRGTGIGRQLLASSESWAKTRGASEMRLDVWEFAEGPAGFYEECGFRGYRRSFSLPLT